ncbi:hypothetical protein [Kaistia adipata]|uniref:hypothetical protein n=1 Tax=Kaistia adipata TaxID=166954 RepID=UPI00040EAE7B|nr:hypothetical protein [Kaistia adipata]
MRTSVINGGIVTNVVLAGDGWVPPEGAAAVASETANIGDFYADGVFTPPPAPEPPLPPPPSEISRRQFFQALAMPDYGLITEAEALAAVQAGAIPAAFEAFITTLPAGQQFGARMLLAGAGTFEFEHLISITFGGVQGWTDEQRAALWRFAAAL